MASFVPILIDQERDAHLIVGDGDPRVNGVRLFPGGSIFSSDDGALYVSDGTQWFALGGGLTQATADARYVQLSGATGFMTQTAADIRYAPISRNFIPVADTRATAILPGTNAPSFAVDMKQNSTMALTAAGATGTYSTVATIVPWSDDSAGPSFELAFNAAGMYLRNGTRASGWQAWTSVPSMTQIDAVYLPRTGGNLTGKLFIITALGSGLGSYTVSQLELRAGDTSGDVAMGFHRPGFTAAALIHKASDGDGLYLVNSGGTPAAFHASTLFGSVKVTAPSIEGTVSVLGTNYFTNGAGVYACRLTTGVDMNRGLHRWNLLQFGAAGQNYLLIGNSAAGGFLDVYAGVTADYNATAGVGAGLLAFRVLANGRVTFGATTDTGSTLGVVGQIYTTGWLNIAGSVGVLFASYGGGFYMSDTTDIRTQGSKNLYVVAGNIKIDPIKYIDIGGTQLRNPAGVQTYGSLVIDGPVYGAYAGFYFTTVARYLMWNAQYQGSYTGAVWQWRFNNGGLDLVASIACQGAITCTTLTASGAVTAGAAMKQQTIDVAKVIVVTTGLNTTDAAPASGIGTLKIRVS